MKKDKETDFQKRLNRSRTMAKVRSKNTKPEMKVRKALRELGYGYRLHGRTLPGTPDIFFPGKKKAIFINGCFWHGHHCRAGQNQPKSNLEYWEKKLSRNLERDKISQLALRNLGWAILIIWECELKNIDEIKAKLSEFLSC